jgi:hypothetical protein
MTMDRAKGRTRDLITPAREEDIVEIIQAWNSSVLGDLTGPKLEATVQTRLGIRCTRQGLLKRPNIRKAFDDRINQQTAGKPARPVEVQVLQQRLAAKDGEIAELKRQLSNCKELLVRHYHNARGRLTQAELDAPMVALLRPAEDDA